MEQTCTLWGGPLSLYTGKVRSYLIKKGIAYRELYPSHPRYLSDILPEVGMRVIPVLEWRDGSVIQDTSDIIAFLEALLPEPCFQPPGAVQKAVALLVSAWASEALLPAAMHYRWSYIEDQREFIAAEFARVSGTGPLDAARLESTQRSMQYMASMLPGLGVSPATIPAIEAAWIELLSLLNTHFARHPYLLGGRPSIADFGLMAPAFAHLGRDPVPSALMKLKAPNVFRWTERMNLCQITDGDYPDYPETFPGADALPETLEPILAHLFEHWGPELIAATDHYNHWIDSNGAQPAGSAPSLNHKHSVHASLGTIRFRYREIEMERTCAPQSLWHFQEAANAAHKLTGPDRTAFDQLMARTGGTQVMQLQLKQPMRRDRHRLALA